MNKVLIVGAAVAAAALGFWASNSRASAATGVSLAEPTSIPIKRTITNIKRRDLSVSFQYGLRESEHNPAPVTGMPEDVTLTFDHVTTMPSYSVTGETEIDVSGITFSKVGEYEFYLTEKTTSDEVNFSPAPQGYVVFFHVTNVVDGSGRPTGELKVELVDQLMNDDYEKVPLLAEFSAGTNYQAIRISNEVSGGFADTEKYFMYRIRFEEMPEDIELTVSGQDEEVFFDNSRANPLNYDGDGDNRTYVVVLKHGQEATIGLTHSAVNGEEVNEIPVGLKYTIQKEGIDNDYETTIDGKVATSTAKEVTDGSYPENDDYFGLLTQIVNNKEESVNTGAFIEYWPVAAVLALGIGGFFVVRKVSKRL